MNGIAEPPGKTWFWELEAGVIFADRCIQCGTCVAVCPSNSIGIERGHGLPELVKMCTGCSLCWDFCPRGGLRYEALWPPSTVESEAGEVPVVVKSDSADTYWKLTGGPPGDGLGAVIGRVRRAGRRARRRRPGRRRGDGDAPRRCSPAGTSTAPWCRSPSDDPDEPWKGIATVATTAKEIIDAAGSFYNQTMALAELDL